MNGYYIFIKEPKERSGFHITKGVVIADNAEEALALAKAQYKIAANASICCTRIESKEFFIISH